MDRIIGQFLDFARGDRDTMTELCQLNDIVAPLVRGERNAELAQRRRGGDMLVGVRLRAATDADAGRPRRLAADDEGCAAI